MINKTAYIYELMQTDHSDYYIRKEAECGPYKITRIRNMIKSGAPLTAFYEEPKRGRPTIMTEEMKIHLAMRGPGCISDAKLAQEISSNFGLLRNISRSTINSYRHGLHFQYKPPKQRQQLTEEHKKKRKTFVYSIFNIPEFPWQSIIFSDESRICLKNDGRWVWRRRGDYNPEIFEEKTKFSAGIMVYGAIGHNYKSRLVFTEINMNSEVYAGNLELSGMFQDLQNQEYIFMQDGAPCHTSTKVKNWLHSHCNLLIFWPPNSPDLNPIEMVWAIIKDQLNRYAGEIENLEDLKKKVLDIWNLLDIDVINNLVESFYYRLYLVATHDGESIQSYYRHHHDEEYDQLVQEFLQKKNEEIEIIDIDELIWRREIDFPLPLNFEPYQQVEVQLSDTIIPKNRKTKWSKEEDSILLQQLQIHGPKWTLISKMLPGRSPDSVKKRSKSLAFSQLITPSQRVLRFDEQN